MPSHSVDFVLFTRRLTGGGLRGTVCEVADCVRSANFRRRGIGAGSAEVRIVATSLGGGPSQVPNADLLGRELRHTGFWLLTWLSTAPRSEIVDTYRYLSSLVADGSLSVPVEAIYRLDDYHRALEHAGAPKRGGKVLFAFDERQ
ncbi:MAG: hypothetical protein QOC62_368 [Mycobacterium sp.]|nr:hypothetical protein [Mycobacterium sp.]